MIEKRRPPTKRASAVTPADPETASKRYWRTFKRKMGEGLELAGKALVAAAAAAEGAPLVSKGHLGIPTLTIGALFGGGLALVLIGYHLQAQAKPDE